MQAYLHGGKCCGIKHIEGLQYHPHYILLPKKASKQLPYEGNSYMNSTRPFFHEAAPQETYVERLDRILNFIKVNRPQGVVEIVLAATQLQAWRSLIEERGFKQVTKCKNANSGNNMYIFHLAVE